MLRTRLILLVQATKTEAKNPIQLGKFDFKVSNDKIILIGDVVDVKVKMSLLNPAKLLWGNDNVVVKTQIKTSGLGDVKPIADNNSDIGKAKNRRIGFSSQ
jgi:hypothetical protein